MLEPFRRVSEAQKARFHHHRASTWVRYSAPVGARKQSLRECSRSLGSDIGLEFKEDEADKEEEEDGQVCGFISAFVANILEHKGSSEHDIDTASKSATSAYTNISDPASTAVCDSECDLGTMEICATEPCSNDSNGQPAHKDHNDGSTAAAVGAKSFPAVSFAISDSGVAYDPECDFDRLNPHTLDPFPEMAESEREDDKDARDNDDTAMSDKTSSSFGDAPSIPAWVPVADGDWNLSFLDDMSSSSSTDENTATPTNSSPSNASATLGFASLQPWGRAQNLQNRFLAFFGSGDSGSSKSKLPGPSILKTSSSKFNGRGEKKSVHFNDIPQVKEVDRVIYWAYNWTDKKLRKKQKKMFRQPWIKTPQDWTYPIDLPENEELWITLEKNKSFLCKHRRRKDGTCVGNEYAGCASKLYSGAIHRVRNAMLLPLSKKRAKGGLPGRPYRSDMMAGHDERDMPTNAKGTDVLQNDPTDNDDDLGDMAWGISRKSRGEDAPAWTFTPADRASSSSSSGTDIDTAHGSKVGQTKADAAEKAERDVVPSKPTTSDDSSSAAASSEPVVQKAPQPEPVEQQVNEERALLPKIRTSERGLEDVWRGRHPWLFS